MESRLQIGETAEQRRLRERNRVEQADNNLTEDLFGGGERGQGAGGIADVPLKSMEVSSLGYGRRLAVNMAMGTHVVLQRLMHPSAYRGVYDCELSCSIP